MDDDLGAGCGKAGRPFLGRKLLYLTTHWIGLDRLMVNGQVDHFSCSTSIYPEDLDLPPLGIDRDPLIRPRVRLFT